MAEGILKKNEAKGFTLSHWKIYCKANNQHDIQINGIEYTAWTKPFHVDLTGHFHKGTNITKLGK